MNAFIIFFHPFVWGPVLRHLVAFIAWIDEHPPPFPNAQPTKIFSFALVEQEFSRELDGFEVGIDRRQSALSSRGSFGVAGPPPAAAGGGGPTHGTNGAAWPLDTGR